MKAVLAAVAALVLAPAAAAAQPAFEQGAIVKIGNKHKGKGKGHSKHHGRRGWDDRYDYDDRDDRRDERRAYRQGYREGRRAAYGGYHPGYEQGHHRWSRGEVLPYEYRRQPIYNYYDYGYGPPPRGHAYYRTSTGDIILAAIATGIIVHILTR
ncbi:MAG TPA: RcnB family protein [Caulobacteraceae bacterium]|jgi:Ni/Co efflux regulator RcnB